MLTKEQKTVLWAFVVMVTGFTTTFILQKNFEFIGYVVVVCLLLWVVLASTKHVLYPNFVLWGLFAWSFLHMLGGVVMTNGKVIYTFMIYPIVGEPYNILKYDQIIHAFGFFVGTLVMYYVLKKYLTRPFGWLAVGIVVAMAGLGLGALNEIVEFMMTVLLPNTNVGGYENTALDLISNFIGAILAVFYLKRREK
ncbi:MAG: hypothetical protein COV96_02050 [Candidatus Zambryskibacteria bacterium CG11_big_fil_rev_8_21_14_0_20_42_18]|nr:MAG: hypothetical protein COV96_02050 [Candidatus Zambryskibacteria bacterium CG11_big_fil_rev_8_21_14_0_20_42_18]